MSRGTVTFNRKALISAKKEQRQKAIFDKAFSPIAGNTLSVPSDTKFAIFEDSAPEVIRKHCFEMNDPQSPVYSDGKPKIRESSFTPIQPSSKLSKFEKSNTSETISSPLEQPTGMSHRGYTPKKPEPSFGYPPAGYIEDEDCPFDDDEINSDNGDQSSDDDDEDVGAQYDPLCQFESTFEKQPGSVKIKLGENDINLIAPAYDIFKGFHNEVEKFLGIQIHGPYWDSRENSLWATIRTKQGLGGRVFDQKRSSPKLSKEDTDTSSEHDHSFQRPFVGTGTIKKKQPTMDMIVHQTEKISLKEDPVQSFRKQQQINVSYSASFKTDDVVESVFIEIPRLPRRPGSSWKRFIDPNVYHGLLNKLDTPEKVIKYIWAKEKNITRYCNTYDLSKIEVRE